MSSRMKNRILSLGLAACLTVGLCPLSVSAAAGDPTLKINFPLNHTGIVQNVPFNLELNASTNGTDKLQGTYPVTISGYGGYTRNGLVLWYDGIDNVGTGRHSDYEKTWRDLSGYNRNGTLTGSVKWNEKGLYYPGSTATNYVEIPAVNIGGDYTAEFCYEQDATQTGNYYRSMLSSAFTAAQELFFSDNIFFNRFGSAVSGGKNYKDFYPGTAAFRASGTVNGKATQSFFQAGFDKGSIASDSSIFPGSGNLRLGIGTNNGARNITYSSVRLYNRALTEDEIKGNYTYDKQRFGLTSPDNLPSAGYDPKLGSFNGAQLSYTGATVVDVNFIDGKATVPMTLTNGGIYNLQFSVKIGGVDVGGDLGDQDVGGPNAPVVDKFTLEKKEGGGYKDITNLPGEYAAALGYAAADAPRLTVTVKNPDNVNYNWYINNQPTRQGATLLSSGNNICMPAGLPRGVSYIFCELTHSGNRSFTPLMAVRVGTGGHMSILSNFSSEITDPGTTARVRLYENSSLTDETGTKQGLDAVYGPTLPQGSAKVTEADLRTVNFYNLAPNNGLNWGGYWNYASVTGGWLPLARYDGSSPHYSYQEGKDDTGEYIVTTEVNTANGGIDIPSWTAPPVITSALMQPEAFARGAMHLSVPVAPVALTPPQSYAADADKLNLEFETLDPTAVVSVRTQDGQTLFSQPHDKRVITMQYDFLTPLVVAMQDATGASQEHPIQPEQLRRTVMTWGDHWYYITADGVQSDQGLLPGDFIHLYAGKALSRAGEVYDLTVGTGAGAPAVLSKLEEAQPLYRFTYENSEIDTYKRFSSVKEGESATLREMQLLVKRDALFALDPALPMIYDGVIAERDLGLDYNTILTTEGKLTDLMQPIKLPEGFVNEKIAHISNNLNCDQPWTLVRYMDGSAVGFNYLTGAWLPVKDAAKGSFLQFAAGFFGTNPPPAALDASGYLKTKELQAKLMVYPFPEGVTIGSQAADWTGELITGDHPLGDVVDVATQAMIAKEDKLDEDGKANGSAVGDQEGASPEGGKPSTTPAGESDEGTSDGEGNDADASSEASDAKEGAAGAAGASGSGSAEETAKGEAIQAPPAREATRSYLVVYDVKSAKYQLYDKNDLLRAPEDQLTSVNKQLEQQQLLESVVGGIEAQGKEIKQNAEGLVLFSMTTLGIAALLGCLYLIKRKRRE